MGRELALDRRFARVLYGGAAGSWRTWLSLLLFDDEMLALYAARVAGGIVLADRPWRLLRVLGRHALRAAARRRALARAS